MEYIGSVGPDRRGGLLGNAYALLHPISFAEPFGLSVVEAMACGTPVVAFSRGSMPEIILHGETGFLVNSVIEAAVPWSRCPPLTGRPADAGWSGASAGNGWCRTTWRCTGSVLKRE